MRHFTEVAEYESEHGRTTPAGVRIVRCPVCGTDVLPEVLRYVPEDCLVACRGCADAARRRIAATRGVFR